MKYEKWHGLQDELEMGAVNARLPNFKRKLQHAINLCADEMARTTGTIMVSVSGGKDSVSMLPIVEQAARKTGKDYFIWSHVSTASFPGTVETIKRAADQTGRPLVINESLVDAFEVVGSGSRQKFGKKGYFARAIEEVYKECDVSLSFVGVRGGESKRRQKAVASIGCAFDSHTYGKPVRVVYPLAYMSVIDVFSIITSYDLPVHPIYSKMAVGASPIRLGYITAVDLMDKDTAVFLHVNYPHLYNRLAEVYPDVRLYG